ncbi:hypothetical protein SteCoe_36793 [Stentor coeruleus]|uniref:Calmodulin n=1 Tax=Stentor coeruleus TaxID=5963 RepID=A0A1R2APA7_9CILI|nr:hypothetical protein SteCoe_36793 [Stentor coeruleus]
MARGGYKPMPDMNRIRNFTEDDVLIIQQGFEVFDHGKQLTDINEIMGYLDSINASEKFPTVYNLIGKIAEACPKGANFKTFLETFQMYLGSVETKSGAQKLFDALDYDENQYLDKERLKTLAKEIGEKITDEELDYLIEEGYNCPNGKIDSDAFVRMILKVNR